MNNNSRHIQSRIRKQLKLGLSYCLSLVSVLALSTEAMAVPVAPEEITKQQLTQTQAAPVQTAPAQTDPIQTAQASTAEPNATETESAALRLGPSYNLNFTEGAGHNGFASFGGFFPIFQTPGENVTFLEGRVSVDTDGDFGGGLQAGYRTLINDSTILGAYAGLDARETGSGTFTQAGIGAELLGENWDLMLNANLPLGNSRQVVDSASQAVNPQFVNNQLLIDEQQIDQIEAALTTVSLDGGLELFDFGGGSSLWGRGGVYFLGGEASDDSLGFRASLDYRATNNLRFGAGVQNDGVFGTNAFFSVNASLGGRSQRSYDTDDTGENSTDAQAELWARAAEPINRTNTVLIENQTDIAIVQTDVTAINPDTGNPFVLRHVGRASGANGVANDTANDAANGVANAILVEEIIRDGTVENPFRTIAQAAAASEANADNVIFVQAGNAGGGFTLPDGVQVRSVGPVQQLNTQFGAATLPGSGSGNLPTVTGQVTVGSNSLVSGLEIDPSARQIEELAAAELAAVRRVVNGIVAGGENIALEDNVIRNVDTGISLPDINGTVSIVRNQISNTLNDGISFGDINETDNATITVANNTLENIGNAAGDSGIEFGLIEGDAIANITIANNQLTDVQFDNIFFDDIQGNAVANIAVEGNIINAENVDTEEFGGDGIEFDFIEDNANVTITINDNQISNVDEGGIDINDVEDETIANITVTNNTILNAGAEGIEFEDIENNASATITVSENQITNVGLDGIEFDDIENNTIANITVANNSILGAGTQGIEFDRTENNANATINILNNQIENAGNEGIQFDDIEDDTVSNITIANNNILGAGAQGIEFDLIEDSANATINILNNQISDVGEEGILFNDIQETTTAVITVDGNTITDAGDDGIDFNLIEDEANVTATITNNTIVNPGTTTTSGTNPGDFPSIVIDSPNSGDDEPDDELDEDDLAELSASVNAVAAVTEVEAALEPAEPDGDGVRINHTADTDMCLVLDNNTVINPASDGFDLISNGTGQFQVVDLANVTGRNVGTFDPADIESNEGFLNGVAGEAPCP
ncbi:MAG: right-handed parallel beta-helix repeat-containing protein [Cyanobacteria bacterium J06627_28]